MPCSRGDEWSTPLDVSDVSYLAIYPPIDHKKKKKRGQTRFLQTVVTTNVTFKTTEGRGDGYIMGKPMPRTILHCTLPPPQTNPVGQGEQTGCISLRLIGPPERHNNVSSSLKQSMKSSKSQRLPCSCLLGHAFRRAFTFRGEVVGLVVLGGFLLRSGGTTTKT